MILDGSTLNLETVGVEVLGFTLNLNDVFEKFLRAAVRESLGLSHTVLRDSWTGELHLDSTHRVGLEPDIAARQGNRWLFAADAKYKTDARGIGKQPDLYQLLAYATAMRLPEAALIYADGPSLAPIVDVLGSDIRLRVEHLDLGRAPEGILQQVRLIAQRLVRGPASASGRAFAR